MSKIELYKFVNLFAFISMIFIAAAIALGKWIEKLGILMDIGFAIALIITSIAAFYYARSKRNAGFMICYILALILIVLTYII